MTNCTYTYKDSGVEWIGKVPQDWKITKVKNYCKTVFSGGTPDTTKSEYWDGNISWLPSGEVQNCSITQPVRYITKEGLESSSTKIIPTNTTLIAMTGATCGNVGYLTFDSCANQSVTAYIAKDTTHSKFLYYMLQGAKEEILLNKTGGAQGGINVFNCKNIPVPYLSFVEQQKISDYLDKKCIEIDRVVETEKSVIEKLKEYKQSIITEAVTKGLDKSVPLKDSGIEWIGKIPQHWETCRLKNYALICNGRDFKDVEDENGCFPVVGSGGEFSKARDCIYDKESVLLGRKGTIDKPIYINKAFWTVDTMYYTKLKDITCGKYFYYLCKTINFDFYQYGSTLPSMTQRDLNSILFPLPKKNEQQQIAEYLDKKCSEIDKAIADKEQIVEKLTEYKKSLIYECVTGKRRV